MGERLLEGGKNWQNRPTLVASVQKEGCLALEEQLLRLLPPLVRVSG